jgi:hypothetical protein
VPPIELRGDEGSLFAEHHATPRARVGRWVNTSDDNVEEACSFAWMQLVRCQPAREPAVLPWLTTVADDERISPLLRTTRDLHTLPTALPHRRG